MLPGMSSLDEGQRLHAVFAASPVAILEVGLDDSVRLWNPAAERIFGWTEAEVLGRRVPLVPPELEQEFRHLVDRVRTGTTYLGYETVRVHKDGRRIDVEISAAPIHDTNGTVTGHIAVFADVTARRRQDDELKASRIRIVQAADEERRRLERNLHDGAQQRLVTLALTLRLARARLDDEPGAARELIETASAELAEALAELREFARGIHPALLTERGLEPALDALARRTPVEVEIDADLPERLPGSIEAAAYYVVAEALTNVAKYAGASCALVRVTREDGRAVIEVSDDGVGGADAGRGSGLRGLSDRVEALGGRLEVESPPGSGTRLRAEIPG
jgi:PAS domain S-box-containing protein